MVSSVAACCVKPNSITLAGSKLVADRFEAKFHYASWFEANGIWLLPHTAQTLLCIVSGDDSAVFLFFVPGDLDL